MLGRRSLRVLCGSALFAISLVYGACTFRTADVYRPLVLESFPRHDRLEALRLQHFPDEPQERFRESLKLTRTAWDYFDIQAYQSTFARIDIDRLVRAIALAPRNPFAWTQLGAYLALQHRPQAAVAATDRSLEVLSNLSEPVSDPSLAELRVISLLNQAIYHNASGQHAEALFALNRIKEVRNLSAFRQLAYYWAAAQAFTGLGDFDRSQDALRHAKTVANQGLEPSKSRFDYPQYFEPSKRAVMFEYLEATNLRSQGRYAEAIAKLQHALYGPYRESNPELYDARFLLATIYQQVGELDKARRELESLATTAPPKLFRLEAVRYQLALVLIDQGELREAELELHQAIRILRHRNAALDIALDSPPSNSAHAILESARADDGWIFSPAFTLLAQAYAQRDNWDLVPHARSTPLPPLRGEESVDEHRESDRRLLAPHASARKAEELLKLALGEEPLDISGAARATLPGVSEYRQRHVAHQFLGRLYWISGDFNRALIRYRRALTLAPDDPSAFVQLISLACSTSNEPTARAAYSLILEKLPIEAAPLGINERLGRLLAGKLMPNPQSANSSEFAHLRFRLQLLQGDLEGARALLSMSADRLSEALWTKTGDALVQLASQSPVSDETLASFDTLEIAEDLRAALGMDEETSVDLKRLIPRLPRLQRPALASQEISSSHEAGVHLVNTKNASFGSHPPFRIRDSNVNRQPVTRVIDEWVFRSLTQTVASALPLADQVLRQRTSSVVEARSLTMSDLFETAPSGSVRVALDHLTEPTLLHSYIFGEPVNTDSRNKLLDPHDTDAAMNYLPLSGPGAEFAVPSLWEVRDFCFALAELNLRAGNVDAARRFLRASLTLEPGWAEAEFRLAALATK